ncbi:hypothetical protein QVD17_27720 [Tagetes erecta]|uniref:Uncharacterized protein n=1 Tax=Tagetes erecta TaxID=13708 RepID=A0AAD8NJR9_TARER|nr:hypothetical protein QVD17_27720 [Tagetes erecta]
MIQSFEAVALCSLSRTISLYLILCCITGFIVIKVSSKGKHISKSSFSFYTNTRTVLFDPLSPNHHLLSVSHLFLCTNLSKIYQIQH